MPKHALGAAVVITDESERVLLVKHTYGRRNWEVPGGGCEEGESAAEAAVREAREELGVSVALDKLAGVYWEPTWSDGVGMHHFVFTARLPAASVLRTADPAEIADIAWFSRDHLPRPISDFTVLRIDDALAGRWPAVTTVSARIWLE